MTRRVRGSCATRSPCHPQRDVRASARGLNYESGRVRQVRAPEVLHLEEVERPVPKEDEVLVKVRAAAVTRADCATREANRRSGLAVSLLSRSISGIRRPKQRILGSELAGEVEAVGVAVSEFAVGDEVFGTSGFRFGAHAEFVCMRESARIARKPAGMSFEEAAAVCDGGLKSLWCLRPGSLR